MDRRQFIKTAGLGAAAIGVAACVPAGKQDKTEGQKGPEAMATHLGTDISLLGYGCMRWQMKKDENGKDIIDQDSVNELVDYAMAHGINYFDSAPVYLRGQSEAATGKALSRYPRESYYVATKLSNHRGTPTLEAGKEMYYKSFENFSTDYLDYYLLHCIVDIESFKKRFLDTGLLDFLVEERKAGRIRNLGYSVHCDKETFDYLLSLHGTYHWDFVQIQMNYLDWTHADASETNADYMYAELDRLEIPVIIMEPLRGGGLADIPAQLADKLKEREPEKSIASWAFRFAGSFPRVLTVLSGMTYMEHLQDNLDTYLDFEPLDEEELTLLEVTAKMMTEYPLVKCTACEYCMPCPYGIDIPGLFRFYNRHIKEGTYVVSADQEDYAKIRRRYLLEYDKTVPTVRQADHCIGCGKCKPRCPQHIDIPKELRKIDLYIESLKQEKI